MIRSCRRYASILSVESFPEQLVKEVQFNGWSPSLDSRLVKNLQRFSPRQCALILNGISRKCEFQTSRRLVHLLSQKLSAVMSDLTLRDLALVIHAMSKLSLRNEIFISESLEAIERKIKMTPQHTNKTVSATALISRSIVKMNLIGDGSFLNDVKTRHLPNWLSEGLVNEIDAVTFLPLVLENPQVSKDLVAVIQSPEVKASAVFILGKAERHGIVPANWWKELDEAFDSNLNLGKKVQAFSGISVLFPRPDPSLASRWVSKLTQDLLSSAETQKQLIFLTVSAMTRFVEILPQDEMISFVEQILNYPEKPKEFAIILNCLAAMRLQLPLMFKAKIEQQIISGRAEVDAHSFPIIISSLTRLGEEQLVVKMLHAFSPSREQICVGLTNQGRDLALMAIASIWDLQRGEIVLGDWLETLLLSPRENLAKKMSIESTSQARIVQSMLGIELVNIASVAVSPNIISSFHSQVAETIRSVVTEEGAIDLNAIDDRTGYEIDIRIQRT